MGNRDDWPAEVQTAYGKYKAAVDKHREAQASYNDYMAAIGHRTTDPEVFLRRAELAIGWGQAACKYVARFRFPVLSSFFLFPLPACLRICLPGFLRLKPQHFLLVESLELTQRLCPFTSRGATRRMVFIKSLGRYAYKDVPSVLRHIDQGMDCVNSSRTAVERARSSIKSKSISSRVDTRETFTN